MKIMVTGGAGFIGSNLVDTYIDNGHDVIVIDNLSTGTIRNINPKAKFYNIDIRDKELSALMKEEQPDVINHHAAQKSVPASVDNPLLDADINIIGLINILESSIKSRVKKVIFASSGGALSGNCDMFPSPEVGIPSLYSPYAISKHVSEQYLQFYSRTYGLEYTILRYSNVYGNRQTAEGECGVIPIFVNNILNGKPSYLYTFDDMPRGATRDYIHINDVCSANLCALTKGKDQIYNIGLGQEVSVADVYDLILKEADTNLPLIKMPARLGDIRRSALDSTKAQKELNWSPQIDIDKGIKLTIA